MAPCALAGGRTEDRLQRQLDALVRAKDGPPGAIVTLRRGSHTRVFTAGVANARTHRRPRVGDHMRIASVAKAFSGAVALRLVARGELRLGQTIGRVLPGLPAAWSRVTVRQLLNHTSGVPDYTASAGFRKQFEQHPREFVPPRKIIAWVEHDPLVFSPGTRYAYSNTDNIVIGLMARKITGRSYASLLRRIVFRPLHLRRTSFPRTTALHRPFIHGYVVE